jgi:hypothetical protein
MRVVADSARDAQASRDRRPVQHLVSLVSVEDDAIGEELEVVCEIELGTRIIEQAELPAIERDGLDDAAELDAVLDAVRWGAVTSADQRALQAPFRSGITTEDYQLEPLARALRMPRTTRPRWQLRMDPPQHECEAVGMTLTMSRKSVICQ